MTKYHNEIYLAELITARGCVWCFSEWATVWDMETGNMPALICAWQKGNDPVIGMHHQSLQ